MSRPWLCCLCGHAMPNGERAGGDHLGARVDRCSAFGASYEHLSNRPGGMRDVDMCDPDLALEEARARGEQWKSLAELVRAHKKWRKTGRKLGERKPSETTIEGFGRPRA